MKISIQLRAPSQSHVSYCCPVLPPHKTADQFLQNNVGDPAKFQHVFSDLQLAVPKHDAAAVAALVNYPITINPDGTGLHRQLR